MIPSFEINYVFKILDWYASPLTKKGCANRFLFVALISMFTSLNFLQRNSQEQKILKIKWKSFKVASYRSFNDFLNVTDLELRFKNFQKMFIKSYTILAKIWFEKQKIISRIFIQSTWTKEAVKCVHIWSLVFIKLS